MLPSIFLWGFGLLLAVWGFYRMKTDFKNHKGENNIIQLIFTGQASGIGQFSSGIAMIIIGFVAFHFSK
ncbi:MULTISPECIES: hypothetical protein [Vagococcus]|uniref:Uncharacterized protein n=1 Tax=Vagococcus fluvialis bH819 TaxID=1255619 RepID=A0A1X6WK27_9ENTE|nr:MULTISPECIES: hypothetical protein [Vagococcus]SLM84590.1 hypothetical protein FM121_00760 [Vagococcus fluvialis bH819]HCM89946.1 hypothetical protein [Vagococcus sp.]